MKFELTQEEVDKYEDWIEKHNKSCPIHYTGAIGGKITFKFTATSLGMLSSVSCACGEELLLTNTEDF